MDMLKDIFPRVKSKQQNCSLSQLLRAYLVVNKPLINPYHPWDTLRGWLNPTIFYCIPVKSFLLLVAQNFPNISAVKSQYCAILVIPFRHGDNLIYFRCVHHPLFPQKCPSFFRHDKPHYLPIIPNFVPKSSRSYIQ